MQKLLANLSFAISILLASTFGAMAAANFVTYTPAVLAKAEQSGKPYLLDFYAEWCITCRTQDRVIGQLQEEDDRFKRIQVIRVEWDEIESKGLINDLRIPRRSTLVMFDGKNELGRVVAQTGKSQIRKLLELGL